MKAEDMNENGADATPAKKVTLVAKEGDEVNTFVYIEIIVRHSLKI